MVFFRFRGRGDGVSLLVLQLSRCSTVAFAWGGRARSARVLGMKMEGDGGDRPGGGDDGRRVARGCDIFREGLVAMIPYRRKLLGNRLHVVPGGGEGETKN